MSGSGKSYFTKNILEPLGFVRINRDILKTKKKCFDKCIDLMLSNTHKIVIDNTNPSILSRAPYISAAIFYGYKISCLLFTCGETRCKHNNRYRNYVSLGGIPYTPNIAYNIYKKKYEKPTKYEGFDRIAEIPFLYEGIYMDKIKYDMYYL